MQTLSRETPTVRLTIITLTGITLCKRPSFFHQDDRQKMPMQVEVFINQSKSRKRVLIDALNSLSKPARRSVTVLKTNPRDYSSRFVQSAACCIGTHVRHAPLEVGVAKQAQTTATAEHPSSRLEARLDAICTHEEVGFNHARARLVLLFPSEHWCVRFSSAAAPQMDPARPLSPALPMLITFFFRN